MKKAEQMELAVQQWKDSGLTQKAFCEKIGIKRTTFATWLGRSRENGKTGFITIAPERKPVLEAIEIIYPNGVRIKTTSCQKQILADLIRLY
jgi:hypothetical protein